MEQEIIKEYVIGKKSMRSIAKIFNTNHKLISRILKKNNITTDRKNRDYIPTEEHKKNLSISCKGKSCWAKGKKMTENHIRKNMVAKLNRPLITYEILLKYDNIDKLKFLNGVISRHRKEFLNDQKYINYLDKFWNDSQFNEIYQKWIDKIYDKWYMPSIDHILPKSKMGNFDLENLRFITWFENRTKSDIDDDTWEIMKKNINNYFI